LEYRVDESRENASYVLKINWEVGTGIEFPSNEFIDKLSGSEPESISKQLLDMDG
jgi:hypothetical protein